MLFAVGSVARHILPSSSWQMGLCQNETELEEANCVMNPWVLCLCLTFLVTATYCFTAFKVTYSRCMKLEG
jgi:hypothetical protein